MSSLDSLVISVAVIIAGAALLWEFIDGHLRSRK
jgi:hypothetical protein